MPRNAVQPLDKFFNVMSLVAIVGRPNVGKSSLTIEATGDHDKLDAILSLLHRFGIKEVARTGSVAMRRSKKCE